MFLRTRGDISLEVKLFNHGCTDLGRRVLGDWSATATMNNGRVDVLFWRPSTEKVKKGGKISPVKHTHLDWNHLSRTVRRGLFGLGGKVQLSLQNSSE